MVASGAAVRMPLADILDVGSGWNRREPHLDNRPLLFTQHLLHKRVGLNNSANHVWS